MSGTMKEFGEVKAKNSSEEALRRWRKACWLVKNKKRRFRFTANLSKRFEAADIRRSFKVFSLSFSFFSIGGGSYHRLLFSSDLEGSFSLSSA